MLNRIENLSINYSLSLGQFNSVVRISCHNITILNSENIAGYPNQFLLLCRNKNVVIILRNLWKSSFLKFSYCSLLVVVMNMNRIVFQKKKKTVKDIIRRTTYIKSNKHFAKSKPEYPL